MNKGETGQSNGEKTTNAKEKFKTVDATTARRCLRSVGFRGSSQAFIECENGSAYKCPDHSVSLVIKLDKIEPASFEGAYDHTNDCIRISSDLPRRQAG
jgi:hypothetical protein